jgi:hypothetical protein
MRGPHLHFDDGWSHGAALALFEERRAAGQPLTREEEVEYRKYVNGALHEAKRRETMVRHQSGRDEEERAPRKHQCRYGRCWLTGLKGHLVHRRGLYFCDGCPSPASRGSLVRTVESHWNPSGYQVSGLLAYAVPNDGHGEVLNDVEVRGHIALMVRGNASIHTKVREARRGEERRGEARPGEARRGETRRGEESLSGGGGAEVADTCVVSPFECALLSCGVVLLTGTSYFPSPCSSPSSSPSLPLSLSLSLSPPPVSPSKAVHAQNAGAKALLIFDKDQDCSAHRRIKEHEVVRRHGKTRAIPANHWCRTLAPLVPPGGGDFSAKDPHAKWSDVHIPVAVVSVADARRLHDLMDIVQMDVPGLGEQWADAANAL